MVDTYNPARSVQREGRIARVGSTHQTVTHAVVSTDTTHEVPKADKRSQKERLANLLESAISGPDQHIKTVDEVQMPTPDLPGWPACEHGEREPRSRNRQERQALPPLGLPSAVWPRQLPTCLGQRPAGPSLAHPRRGGDSQQRTAVHRRAPTSDTTNQTHVQTRNKNAEAGVSDKTVKGRRVRRRWRAFFCALGAGKPGRGVQSQMGNNPHDLRWSEHGSAAAFAAMGVPTSCSSGTPVVGRR